MTEEQMERALEALLAQDTQFNEALNRVREVVELLSDSHIKSIDEIREVRQAQAQTTTDIQLLAGKITELTDNVSRLEAQGEADHAEMREAINNLIIANEVTRDLAEQAARLAIAVSQRITGIDERIVDLESKQ
jgi:hypothetical protein